MVLRFLTAFRVPQEVHDDVEEIYIYIYIYIYIHTQTHEY